MLDIDSQFGDQRVLSSLIILTSGLKCIIHKYTENIQATWNLKMRSRNLNYRINYFKSFQVLKLFGLLYSLQ